MKKRNYFLSFVLFFFGFNVLSSQNYAALVAGVTSMQTSGTPGVVATTNSGNSAAIAGYPNSPIAIASITSGNGKMLTLSHEGFLINSEISFGNNTVFANNAINWLCPANRKSILISTGHGEFVTPAAISTFSNNAISNGYSVSSPLGGFTSANLSGVGMVVIGNALSPIPQAELDALATHLQNGGGILAIGLGWSWISYGTEGSNLDAYPMNQVAALAGQRFIGGTNPSPINTFYPNVLPNSNNSICASKGIAPWETWVASVALGANNNVSDKFKDFATLGYSDYTSNVFNVTKGESYPLSVKPGLSWEGNLPNAYCRAWIDFNNNKAFEANELVLERTNANPLTANVLIPNTAITGSVRMRVSVKRGGYPTACETFDSGEVEDYSVNITGGTVNTQPDLTITNVVAPSSARVNENLSYSFRFKNLGGTAVYVPNSFNPIQVTALLESANLTRLNINITIYKDIVAGFDSLITFNDIIPADITAGNYNLVFKVDEDNFVAESNENNNTVSVPIIINAATTDNSKLIVTNVTGATTGEPNGTIPLSITIKNDGTLPSAPDSVFMAGWRQPGFATGYFPYTYSKNKVAVPTIAAGQSVVVNATFQLPSPLKTDLLDRFFVEESYILLRSKDRFLNSRAPIPLTEAKATSYFYPIQPASSTDLALTSTQLNPTWDAGNNKIDVKLSLKNNGTSVAKNVYVNIHTASVGNGAVGTFSPDITDFVKVSGVGDVTPHFKVTGSREENGVRYHYWIFPELAAGATVEATFSGKIVGLQGPETNASSYKDYTIRPQIQYADVRDANRSNDTVAPMTYRWVLSNAPDLTIQNLTIPTPSVQAGQILNYSFDAKNIGTAAATGNFTIKAYISTDNVLSANDIQNGTIPTANFAAGLTQPQVAGASTIPASLAAGNYYLILKVDADNQITESNEGNNVIVSINTFSVTNVPTNVCIRNFTLNGLVNDNCNTNFNGAFLPYFGTLQTRGASLADGIQLSTRSPNSFDRYYYLFGNTATTTPPAGSVFNNCPNVNWLYFTTNGYGFDERTQYLDSNIVVRVRYWGAITNPDSVLVEFSNERQSLKSTAKTTNCNSCIANDRTPPTINCPTTTVTFSQSFSPDQLSLQRILDGTGITATDNCGAVLAGRTARNILWGGVYPIQLVAYDSAGNSRVCNFNLRMPCENPPFGISFSSCPTDTTLVVAAGQTCRAYNWTAPFLGNGGSPFTLTSNFNPGFCFPVGTTRVIYTARDSCGSTATCAFNVTVTGGTTGGNYCASKGTAPWEYWVGNVSLGTINNNSDKFKDFATLGYSDYTNVSTTLNKGQSYPLSISPGLSWIGNLPNAYVRVWIDFNQNKTFEANELVLEKTNQNPLTQSVLIPATALTGNTRMRVALKFGSYPTACETFDRGEVEDYTVNITGGGTCTPTDLSFVQRCPSDTTIIIPATATCGTVSWAEPTVRDNCGNPITINQINGFANGACFPIRTEGVSYRTSDPRFSPFGCNFNVTVVRQTANQPDLTISNLTVPTPSVSQGQILNFKADLKNIGTAAATGNFTVKSYLSTDQTLSANDYQNGTIPTANFAASFTSPQVAGAMTVNTTVAAGQYYLILKIDADNQITESNEGNNTIVSTGLITVTSGTTGGGADLALSIAATPSVFRKYEVNTVRVTAQNVGNQALTNVKIELKRPALTSNGGSKVPSVGTFQDFCPGGIECSEWTIPTLAAGATATLDAPFFVLDANAPIVVTTKLLSSTPTDANTVNNTATVSISPAAAGAAASILALSRPKPSQFMPIVVQSVEPTMTDGNVTVRLESIVEKEVSFNIYNSMGKQIFSEKRKVEKGGNLLNFDVSELAQGLYLIAPESSFARNAPSKFIKF
jgi:subtilase family serine protease